MSTAESAHTMLKVYVQMNSDKEFFTQIVDTVNDHAARLTLMGLAHKANQWQVYSLDDKIIQNATVAVGSDRPIPCGSASLRGR